MKRKMQRDIKYTDEPLGTLRVVRDFLPPPKDLVLKEENVTADRNPVSPLCGSHKVVHAFWLAGMSCNGCSTSTVGVTNPPVEALLSGTIPGLPCIILHHPVLSLKAGEEFVQQYDLTAEIPHRNTTAGDATLRTPPLFWCWPKP